MEGQSNPEIAEVVKLWSNDDLIAAGEALEGIEDHPAWQVLTRALIESRTKTLDTLARAKPTESVGALNKYLGLAYGIGTFFDAIPTLREKAAKVRVERERAAERADAERQGT